MPVQINYKNNKTLNNSKNLLLFVDENLKISNLKKYILKSEFNYISDLLETKDKKKKIITFNISSKKTIILITVKSDVNTSDVESLGAKFYDYLKNERNMECDILSDTISFKLKNFLPYRQ